MAQHIQAVSYKAMPANQQRSSQREAYKGNILHATLRVGRQDGRSLVEMWKRYRDVLDARWTDWLRALRSWKTPTVPTNVTELIGFKQPVWNNLNDEPEKLKATWLVHACFLFELITPPGTARGPWILFDPVFSHRCGPASWLGSGPCPVQQLPEVDAIVISHCHYDHLDIPTIKSVVFPPSKPTSIALLTHVFAPLKNEDLFQSLSIPFSNYHCLDWWLNRDVTVHLLAAPSTSESESAVSLLMLLVDQETPSNRLWYTFTTLSQTEISIEPVASDLQIR
ncbi:hypothetical protein M422DRAFT_245505 [Sphaerobolus stellatus SS14]|nr:hypothetical protein M422DRAFT_245505 [Sphaerobolus stellatus SS14]